MAHHQCETIRPGRPCIFMKNGKHQYGCTYNNQTCCHIIEQCKGCEHIDGEDKQQVTFCNVYAEPAVHWLAGNCPMATNIKVEEEQKKKILNPLKAAKLRKKGLL